MEKTINPEKYNMVVCLVCDGKGKLPKNPHGFDVCKECGGFGLVKKEPEGDVRHFANNWERKPIMKEGDIFENLLDGEEYVVKQIVNSMVVLRSRRGDTHIITGIETLRMKSFYLKKNKRVNQRLPISRRITKLVSQNMS